MHINVSSIILWSNLFYQASKWFKVPYVIGRVSQKSRQDHTHLTVSALLILFFAAIYIAFNETRGNIQC